MFILNFDPKINKYENHLYRSLGAGHCPMGVHQYSYPTVVPLSRLEDQFLPDC